MWNMASIPIEKQFARFGISNHLGLSPETLRKFGPLVPPKPKKAQPQVPVIPKSFMVPTCVEPSFSTVLKNLGSNGTDMSNNYENLYENGGPIYSNLHSIHGTSPYLPPPPPPPALSTDVDLPLPPPPPASDLSFYSELDVSGESLHFPAPPTLLDAVTSPPSPVSSSYSELRRAVGSTTGSANYAPLSQVKSVTIISEFCKFLDSLRIPPVSVSHLCWMIFEEFFLTFWLHWMNLEINTRPWNPERIFKNSK